MMRFRQFLCELKDEFVFHGTSDTFLSDIRKYGLYDKDDKVMFTSSFSSAQLFAKTRTDPRLKVGGNPIVLRTRPINVNRIYDEQGERIYNMKSVPADKLQLLTKKGWVSL